MLITADLINFKALIISILLFIIIFIDIKFIRKLNIYIFVRFIYIFGAWIDLGYYNIYLLFANYNRKFKLKI
jgi:hypothetical protein